MLSIGILSFLLFFMAAPFFVILIIVFVLVRFSFYPEIGARILVQQIFNGISPLSLVCIPMFILAANIITSGDSSKRIIDMLKTYLGHIPGALPIITCVGCMLFGSVSGSTQATVAAIGGTMRPMLLEAGYSSSFTFGLMVNASDIAYLIPPSIGFIIYGIIAQVSIGKLFLAGIGPGILVTILFSIYCYVYSKLKNVGLMPKASWKERIQSTKAGILVMGFPVIIFWGIFGGIFSPTEAAATSVLYALILEGLFYRTLTFKKFFRSLTSTGILTAVVMSMVGVGKALSWLVAYSGIGKIIMPSIMGNNPSALKIMIIINVVYFIHCMFTSPMIGYYIYTPIFAPYIAQAGLNPILIGVIVVLQSAIGSATPPFGCDIFTAMVIFRRPYYEVVRESWPFILILLLAAGLLMFFPEIALFIPNKAVF